MTRPSASLLVGIAVMLAACTGTTGSPVPSAAGSLVPSAVAPVPSAVASPAPSAAGSPVPSPAASPADFKTQMAWLEGQPTPDGCLVVTAAEVSAASGFEVIKTMANQNDQPGCAYFDADGLILSTRFHQRATTGQANFDAEAARGPLEISGIGDEAIWIERAWQLWAWRGDTLVIMGIGRIGETPERLALAKKLGPLVVARFR